MICLELCNPEAKQQLQTKGQFSAPGQTTSSLQSNSHRVVQGPTQMEAISLQGATLEWMEGCSEEDAFSVASSSPGHLSCIQINETGPELSIPEIPAPACTFQLLTC